MADTDDKPTDPAKKTRTRPVTKTTAKSPRKPRAPAAKPQPESTPEKPAAWDSLLWTTCDLVFFGAAAGLGLGAFLLISLIAIFVDGLRPKGEAMLEKPRRQTQAYLRAVIDHLGGDPEMPFPFKPWPKA